MLKLAPVDHKPTEESWTKAIAALPAEIAEWRQEVEAAARKLIPAKFKQNGTVSVLKRASQSRAINLPFANPMMYSLRFSIHPAR